MNITPEPEEPISVVPFPTLDQDAYTGLPGKIVEAVAPYTEAHPAPILLQYLSRYGVHVGRTHTSWRPTPNTRRGSTR